MTSTAGQAPLASAGPPASLSRYKSTRRTQQQPTAKTVAFNPSSLPISPSPLAPVPSETELAVNNENSNGELAPHPSISVQHVRGASDDGASSSGPLASNLAIQRSMSRYRKNQKSTNIPASPMVPTATAGLQGIHTSDSAETRPVDDTGRHSNAHQESKVEGKHSGRELRTEDIKRVERLSRGGPIALPSPQERRNEFSHQLSYRSPYRPVETNQKQPPNDSNTLHASASRYRKRTPNKQGSLPDMKTATRPAELPNTLPLRVKQEYRESVPQVRDQIAYPLAPSMEPSAPQRLLTKASLDQVPDSSREDAENYLRQVKAITRETIIDPQKKLELPKAPRAHASRAQSEVKKLMDAEADRQRRMQEKMKMERDKAKAEEEAKAAEKRQREEKEQQEKAEAEAAAKQRKEMERAERKKKGLLSDQILPKRHQRKESEEERSQRYRDKSLNALEGAAPRGQESRKDGQDQFVPGVPKAPLGFLKKRRIEGDMQTGGMQGNESYHSSEVKEDGNNIKVGGGGAVPGIDAPISAVNAGDRRVLVECNQSSIYMPVTTMTTPFDLIRSAATCLNESIDPKATVLLEAFGKIGVQRPLRTYEHIRDVMNSWDDDRQNSLVLVQSPTGGADAALECSSVEAEQPDESSFPLIYSQKPGKWEKRWVTLRSDGQVVSAKNETHKEITNVCHMSDFDIYTPTEQELKQIKAPKKLCFAIKSQQKSSMFMSTENFVHFFCSGDKKVAAQWYKAVQSWRSWYLVNVMGKGTKPQPKNAAPVLPEINGSQPQQRPGSRDSHYQLGSFKPLLDLDMFTSFSSSAGAPPPTNTATGGHSRNHSRSKHPGGALPPSSFPAHPAGAGHGRTRSKSLTRAPHPKDADTDTFAPSGLLGRSYTTRQNAHKDREQHAGGPFTGGLLGGAGPGGQAGGGVGGGAGTWTAGRGVMDGSKVRVAPDMTPMLDLTPASAFVDGSLLQRVEREQGPRSPVIEREKGAEVVVGTGERV